MRLLKSRGWPMQAKEQAWVLGWRRSQIRGPRFYRGDSRCHYAIALIAAIDRSLSPMYSAPQSPDTRPTQSYKSSISSIRLEVQLQDIALFNQDDWPVKKSTRAHVFESSTPASPIHLVTLAPLRSCCEATYRGRQPPAAPSRAIPLVCIIQTYTEG